MSSPPKDFDHIWKVVRKGEASRDSLLNGELLAAPSISCGNSLGLFTVFFKSRVSVSFRPLLLSSLPDPHPD